MTVYEHRHIAEYAIPYGLHKYLPSVGRKSVVMADDRPSFMIDGRRGKSLFTKIYEEFNYGLQ